MSYRTPLKDTGYDNNLRNTFTFIVIPDLEIGIEKLHTFFFFKKKLHMKSNKRFFKISQFASHLTLHFNNTYKIKLSFISKQLSQLMWKRIRFLGGAGNSIASRVFSKFLTL